MINNNFGNLIIDFKVYCEQRFIVNKKLNLCIDLPSLLTVKSSSIDEISLKS